MAASFFLYHVAGWAAARMSSEYVARRLMVTGEGFTSVASLLIRLDRLAGYMSSVSRIGEVTAFAWALEPAVQDWTIHVPTMTALLAKSERQTGLRSSHGKHTGRADAWTCRMRSRTLART